MSAMDSEHKIGSTRTYFKTRRPYLAPHVASTVNSSGETIVRSNLRKKKPANKSCELFWSLTAKVSSLRASTPYTEQDGW